METFPLALFLCLHKKDNEMKMKNKFNKYSPFPQMMVCITCTYVYVYTYMHTIFTREFYFSVKHALNITDLIGFLLLHVENHIGK